MLYFLWSLWYFWARRFRGVLMALQSWRGLWFPLVLLSRQGLWFLTPKFGLLSVLLAAATVPHLFTGFFPAPVRTIFGLES